jgi:hypothetical protein
MNVVETLQAEHTELTSKLTEMDELIRTQRPGLVAQIAQLSRAIVALTKPVPTPGTRRPMSDAGKAAIRAGLEKARAAKLAGTAGSKTDNAMQQSQPAAAEPQQGAKKPVAADKGATRGV